MIKRALVLAAVLAAATLCGCGQKARPPASAAPASSAAPSAAPAAATPTPAFSHDPSLEVFGYYMPTAPVEAAPFRLRNLSIGTEEDFRNWEANHRLPSYGPVMLEFDDTSSAKATAAETGAEGYAVTVRVLPDSYAVGSNGVSFTGHDARLGQVSFQGRFDAHGFAAVKRGEAADSVVLIGTLKAGGKAFPDVRFTWFGGD